MKSLKIKQDELERVAYVVFEQIKIDIKNENIEVATDFIEDLMKSKKNREIAYNNYLSDKNKKQIDLIQNEI